MLHDNRLYVSYIAYWGTDKGQAYVNIHELTQLPSSIELTERVPKEFRLEQNYPNPFNTLTNISFSIPLRSFVSLKVFDALGREVTTLLSEDLSAGTYSQQWNATGLLSGICFYRLQASNYCETKQLVLLR
jgi:hypothetical protein